MITFTTMVVFVISSGVGIYFARQLIEKNHDALGLIPFLAIAGLMVLALFIDTEGMLFLGAALLTATLCATIWSNHWEDERARRPKQVNSLARHINPNPRFGPEDDPFRRRETGQFGAQEGSQHTFVRTAPGVRRTASGVVVRLRASTRLPKSSTSHRKADLRLVQ